MKYTLRRIGPNSYGNAFEFDTNNIFDLSKLGRSDGGVVCFDGIPCTIESRKPDTTYIRNLEAVVSEAVDILKNLIEMDNTGLVFVASADGKILERAVAFLAAAKDEDE